jgi:hypothetical protein
MAGAGQGVEVVFLSVVHFFCDVDDMTRRAGAAGCWHQFRLHGLTLASLRQARHMEPRMAAQIDMSLLRVRVAFREIQLDHARWSFRMAMSYVRLSVVDPSVGAQIAPPPPRRVLGETDANVTLMVDNAALYFQRAFTRGVALDIWNPPSSTAASEDEEEESDFDDDASVVPDEDSDA